MPGKRLLCALLVAVATPLTMSVTDSAEAAHHATAGEQNVSVTATPAVAIPSESARPRARSAARSCGALRIYARGIVVRGIRARGVGCGRALDVAVAFYGQTIGSSGATVALGYGCAYGGGGSAAVTCRGGARRVTWQRELLGGAPAVGGRRCRSVTARFVPDGEGAAVGIRAKRIGCRAARRFASRCLHGRRGGWVAFRTTVSVPNASLIAFQRRRALVALGYVGGGGCSSDLYGI